MWLEDSYALPLPAGDTHVCRVWMSADGKEYSAKLKGGVDGAQRDALWEELKAFTPLERSENRLTKWSRSILSRASASRASRGSWGSTSTLVSVESAPAGALGGEAV